MVLEFTKIEAPLLVRQQSLWRLARGGQVKATA
jgi:hypothetical protein